ncbi:pilus assembly PilX family protein [Pistricoccus aurantiacus]|uniref:pilus assembly PilX family protein n=1 Tax=Pistricoccus aurantiacus TaxID=1883414 RepID=UPI00362A67B9
MNDSLRQKGMALLVTMVMVALMAVLAFVGSDTVRLQQRLASNDHAAQIAFQAAEAALSEAVRVIESAPHRINFCSGVATRYRLATLDALNKDDIRQALTNASEIDFTLNSGVALPKKPRYVIGCVDEDAILGYSPSRSMVQGKGEDSGNRYHFFRILAQGYGPGGGIARTIEARYVFK